MFGTKETTPVDPVVESTVEQENNSTPIAEEITPPVEVATPVAVTPEEISPPVEPKNGHVTNSPLFSLLNVREGPGVDRGIVCCLVGGEKVQLDITDSTNLFFKVHTEKGDEGYCMKQYITID